MTRLLRSLLFVPGVRQDRFAKAISAGADAVIFDLEDSIAPIQKAAARTMIAEFIAASDRTTCLRVIRINGINSPWVDEDVEFVRHLPSIDGVVMPKVETREQVEHVAHTLAETARAEAASERFVLPILETARGILGAPEIARADATMPALIFGAEDLTAQLGVPRTVDGDEVLVARSQVVLAAATIGADAIDTVVTDLRDAELLRHDCDRGRALGFHGKLAIHPDQVQIINEVFTPSAAEIGRAREIQDAYATALANGEGVIRVRHQMIDMPVVLRARRLLALAELLGRR